MILGAIVMSFVVRVMYARRQYSAALRRAIANGDPLPEYRNPLFPSSRYDPNGAFIIPPWLLPVPKLHEDEMNLVYSVEVDHVDTKEKGRIGDGDDDGWDEKWQWISVSGTFELVHFQQFSTIFPTRL
jgi:hypothetical protein